MAPRRLVPWLLPLALVRGDDAYRADGPMLISTDPVTGEPISTVSSDWRCDEPCPASAEGFFGPCCRNSENEAMWNLDEYCQDSLKYHTHFDADGLHNYECEPAVDRYGCGAPIDSLSGWMWQYDLRIECCATCQPDRTRRPTPVPAPQPTLAPYQVNATHYDMIPRSRGNGPDYVGAAGAAGGGDVGGVPIAAILGLVFGLLGAYLLERVYRRYVLYTFRKANERIDDAAANVGAGFPPPRTDLDIKQRCTRGLWSLIQRVAWHFGYVVIAPMDRIDYLRGKFGGKRVDRAFDALGIDDPHERVRWQDKWLEVDADESHLVDRAEFYEYFSLAKGPYTDRFFAMFANTSNDECGFVEFLEGLVECCQTDRLSSEKVAFRLLSRYCDAKPEPFLEKRCLDVADLEQFLVQRGYDNGDRHAAKKRAIKLALYVDADGSGGIDFREFQLFSEKSLVFLALGHRYQTLLRKRVFGARYWFELTKRRRVARAPPPVSWVQKLWHKAPKVAPNPTHHADKGVGDLYDGEANWFRFSQEEFYAGGGRPVVWDAVAKKIKAMNAVKAPPRIPSTRIRDTPQMLDTETHAVSASGCLVAPRHAQALLQKVADASNAPLVGGAAPAPDAPITVQTPVSPLSMDYIIPKPRSPKRVFFTDLPPPPLSPSSPMAASWATMSSFSDPGSPVSPLSYEEEHFLSSPIKKTPPVRKEGVVERLKRRWQGPDPDRAWQEIIEAYCAEHEDRCPVFREDFGFVEESLRVSLAQKRAAARGADDLRGVMDETLCRRLIDTCETLCYDPLTLNGAFYRWKGKMVRAMWTKRPVHADVQDRINRMVPAAEVIADHHLRHAREAERLLSLSDDLAPLPEFKRSRRRKRPRTAPVGLGPERARRPASATGPRPGTGPASARGEAYRQTRRLPAISAEQRGRSMHKLGMALPDGHKVVAGRHGSGPARRGGFVSGRGSIGNIGSRSRPATAPARSVLY